MKKRKKTKILPSPIEEPAPRKTSKAIAGNSSPMSVSAEERRQLIAQEAYFRAERRGFAPGRDLQDWYEAEDEINRILEKKTGELPSGTREQ